MSLNFNKRMKERWKASSDRWHKFSIYWAYTETSLHFITQFQILTAVELASFGVFNTFQIQILFLPTIKLSKKKKINLKYCDDRYAFPLLAVRAYRKGVVALLILFYSMILGLSTKRLVSQLVDINLYVLQKKHLRFKSPPQVI